MLLMGFLALMLAACTSSKMGDMFNDAGVKGEQLTRQAASGRKIALLLPLSASGETKRIAQAMKQAAELALTDMGGSGVTLITKDSGGSAGTAQAAAQAALNEGAELILGPLLAPEVQAVKTAVQGRANIIAFSSASSVAGQGTYLMSFLPEEEVANVVRYAASQGKRSVALLYPQTQYGSNVQAALNRSAGSSGVQIAASQPYARGQSSTAAAQRIAQDVNDTSRGIDALLIPEGGEALRALSGALEQNGITPQRVTILGTGLWDDSVTRATPIAQGGWYAGVAPDMVERFNSKYSGVYGSRPPRIASLAYDAVSLAAGLARSGDFSSAAITSSGGFQGQNGLFRFRSNGLIERGLSILQMTPSGPEVVAQAPSRFGAGY
ncbi:penicillin-binding protein activator [Taklimakanibacter lacteus]|uniref:penicillin-binding protein activator n=1 Tax=Taklimakanibacter lacteus TaxID=2268456 RepID=UPI0013C46BAC